MTNIRFLNVDLFQNVGACNYFMWFDPPMGEQGRIVIVGLLRRIKELEVEKERAKSKINYKQFMFIGIVIGLILLIGCKM